jgi:hypothetical protein
MEIPPNEPLSINKTDKFSFLINLFIKKDGTKFWEEKDWIRERSACKRLLNKYPDFNFFYTLNHLNGKFNSLCGLQSKKFHNLDELWKNYISNKQKNKKYLLNETSTVIIEEIKRKPQNIIEFLDN